MAYDQYDRPRDGRFRDEDRAGGPSGGRGFFERAGDEISSWFGDEEAERRREQDDRTRGYGRDDRDRDYRGRDDRPRGERGFFGGANDLDRGRDRERGGWFGDSDRDSYRPSQATQVDRDRFQDRGRRDLGGQDYSRSRNDEYRPYTGNYGRGSDEYRGSATAFGAAAGAAAAGVGRNHDPHYQEWRQKQIDQLDNDYDDYRREHQSKFDNDFSGWRSQRQGKRQLAGQIREHSDVVGSDDQPVGKVDKLQGDKVILTKDSQGGVHKSFNCHLIDRVEDDRVILSQTAEQARRDLREERSFDERNSGDQRGIFGRDRDDRDRQQQQQRGDGPHMLERSFSGTYPDEGR